MIRASARQFRMGFERPIGLDFGAILAMGAALGAEPRLLAEVLPAVEGAALAMLAGDPDDDDDDADGGA